MLLFATVQLIALLWERISEKLPEISALKHKKKKEKGERENPIAIVALIVAIDEDIFLLPLLVLRRFSP